MAAETVRPGRKIGKVPALKLNWTITVTALSELELLNRKNFYVSVETTFDARGNSVRELVNECKPIRVEFILWLQKELGAIPNARYVRMPRPVRELLGNVSCTSRGSVCGNALARQNYSVHVGQFYLLVSGASLAKSNIHQSVHATQSQYMRSRLGTGLVGSVSSGRQSEAGPFSRTQSVPASVSNSASPHSRQR
jgi:hypothetical protein